MGLWSYVCVSVCVCVCVCDHRIHMSKENYLLFLNQLNLFLLEVCPERLREALTAESIALLSPLCVSELHSK